MSLASTAQLRERLREASDPLELELSRAQRRFAHDPRNSVTAQEWLLHWFCSDPDFGRFQKPFREDGLVIQLRFPGDYPAGPLSLEVRNPESQVGQDFKRVIELSVVKFCERSVGQTHGWRLLKWLDDNLVGLWRLGLEVGRKRAQKLRQAAFPYRPPQPEPPVVPEGQAAPAAQEEEKEDEAKKEQEQAQEEDRRPWSLQEQALLEQGLLKFPGQLVKQGQLSSEQRWQGIAALIPGRSAAECIERFRALREQLQAAAAAQQPIPQQQQQQQQQQRRPPQPQSPEEPAAEAFPRSGAPRSPPQPPETTGDEQLDERRWALYMRQLDIYHSSGGDSGSEDEGDSGEGDEDDDEGDDAASGNEGSSAAVRSLVDRQQQEDWFNAQHRGIELRLKDLHLENIGVLKLARLSLILLCERCSHLQKSSGRLQLDCEPSKTSAVVCRACQSRCCLQYRPKLAHANDASLGYLDMSPGFIVVELAPVGVWVSCENCQHESLVQGYQPGRSKHLDGGGGSQNAGTGYSMGCRACRLPLRVSSSRAEFTELDIPGFELEEDQQLTRMQRKRLAQQERALHNLIGEVRASKKAAGGGGNARHGLPKEGQPLPMFGTCVHYERSCRWLRFPCCGRTYPCDLCHDEQSDHKMEMANRMVCGFCSHEQACKSKSIKCGLCKRKLVSGHSAHWEGGKGNRNLSTLSRTDNKKYAGKKKTISRRAQNKVEIPKKK